jgi:hypothetical protein
MLGLGWFVKMAVTSGTAMGIVDVGVQAWEQGMCYRHKAKKKTTNMPQYPPPTPAEDKNFECDMMRVVRSAAFGAALAPLLNGLTLFFATPGAWMSVTIDVIASECIFAPITLWLYMDQEGVNIETVRPYVVPSLIIISTGAYAVAYVLTMAMGHSASFLPMLSYLGDLPPESVVFTLGVAGTATFYALLVNIVSKQKDILKQTAANEYISTKQAIAAGYSSVVGLTCIAVFPAHAIAAVAHYAGMSTFILGSIPFLILMTNGQEPSVARTPLFCVYIATSCLYPILYVKVPLLAVVCETLAAGSWVALIYDGKDAITRGPRVMEIEDSNYEEVNTPLKP